MIFSLILLALSLVVYLYFIEPVYQDEQIIKSKQLSQQSFLAYESSAIKQVKNLIDTYQGQLQMQEVVSLALPPNEDLSGALAQVYGLVQDGALATQAISVAEGGVVTLPSSAATSGSRVKLQRPVNSLILQVRASGSYESLKSFLSKLETNLRILDLRSLSIQPAASAQQGQNKAQIQDLYNFDLSVLTYYQGQ